MAAGLEPAATEAAGPLTGLRVVDCSAIIAGPITTAFLATYGADVVKLEPLEGDALRGYPSTLPGQSRYFLGINRGKRSVAVDRGTPMSSSRASGRAWRRGSRSTTGRSAAAIRG